MFKRSRRKIVAAIMAVLALLFLGTLIVIYTASYLDVSESNFEMLAHHAELYMLYDQMKDEDLAAIFPEPDKPNPGMQKDNPHMEPFPEFQLSTFYSVALSYDGQVLATDTADNGVYEESQLEAYAQNIVDSGKTKGINGELIYLVTRKPGYRLVTFMDNRIMQESMNTLFRYTLIFGSIALVALFFLAVYLARRIVRPLEESYQKQKQFISDAGHELKTPISVVNANAEMLQRQIGDNQWLANIQYENERMRLLVGQLLELARTENVMPQMERLDLSHLMTGEVLPFESVAFERGLSILSEIEPGQFVSGNSIQLKQLIAILVDNAIRHNDHGTSMMVKLTGTRNTVLLTVSNAGQPIPKEQLEHLFDRFYRLDESRNGEEQHYGLGLAIAKAIVLSHKGKIEVQCSNGLVSFCVTLPKIG